MLLETAVDMSTSNVKVLLCPLLSDPLQPPSPRGSSAHRLAGVGKVKARDNAQSYGTENEPRLRNPDDPFYKKFAAECSRYQIAVDIFSFA